MVHELLSDVASKNLNLQQMNADSSKIKKIRDIQTAFVRETGLSTWTEAKEKFPEQTTTEALDEFTSCKFTSKSTPQRYCACTHLSNVDSKIVHRKFIEY